MTVTLYISKPGTKPCAVLAPRVRWAEIVEEYQLLGWDVNW